MKTARFVLKIVAGALTAAATVCCIIAYWEKIVEAVTAVGAKLGCPRCAVAQAEYDDYADWDE